MPRGVIQTDGVVQAHNLSMVELQGWISSCRKFLKTNMGSFLMRSARDEPLLIGRYHLKEYEKII
jgi:hypothetical protein